MMIQIEAGPAGPAAAAQLLTRTFRRSTNNRSEVPQPRSCPKFRHVVTCQHAPLPRAGTASAAHCSAACDSCAIGNINRAWGFAPDWDVYLTCLWEVGQPLRFLDMSVGVVQSLCQIGITATHSRSVCTALHSARDLHIHRTGPPSAKAGFRSRVHAGGN